jgi:hypothetical protein
MVEEKEEKLALLEKRLVANVDFDHQALQVLGFSYGYLLHVGHLCGCYSPTECQ